MQPRLITVLFFYSILPLSIFAQSDNPFNSIHKKSKVTSLSDDKYDEQFDKNDIQQIGSALVNIRTMQVVKVFKDEAQAQNQLDNSISSRFLSVDPIAKKYPELTPYQYASNRPIDGIDRDGLEYATFRINVDKNNSVTKITVTTDYELKNNGTKGPGVEYYITKDGQMPEGSFVKNNYGIYQGADNPQLPKVGQNYKAVYDTYILKPIDESDASAKEHDQDLDNATPEGLRGVGGVLSPESTKANKDYIKRADIIIEKQKKGGIDKVTGKPVTVQAAEAAKTGKKAFQVAEYIKKDKNKDKTRKEIIRDSGPKF